MTKHWHGLVYPIGIKGSYTFMNLAQEYSEIIVVTEAVSKYTAEEFTMTPRRTDNTGIVDN